MKSDTAATNRQNDGSVGRTHRSLDEAIPAQLPNGGTVFVFPEVLDPGGNVSVLELDFDWFRKSLDGLAEVVKGAFDRAKPTKTSVELHLQLGIKAGKLAAMLVDADSSASFKVTLEWEGSGAPTS